MKNKILVELIVPEVETSYNVFLPINRKIGNVIVLLSRAVSELTGGVYVVSNKTNLYDVSTGNVYNMDATVLDTDIRNGSKIVLF